MRKIKKYFIIILLSIFTLTTVETSSLNFSAYIVQAKASSSTKRKAQEAYRKFLTQRRYRYFTLWDIDKDGLKMVYKVVFQHTVIILLMNCVVQDSRIRIW